MCGAEFADCLGHFAAPYSEAKGGLRLLAVIARIAYIVAEVALVAAPSL